MAYFPFLIAKRYLYTVHADKSIATMVKIAFLGIVIGAFALTLVAAIMKGFEQATYQTIQGCHAALTMHSYGTHLAYKPIEKILNEEFPEISSFSPSDIQYCLIANSKHTLSNVVIIKGIDPLKEAATTNLEKKIITPLNDSLHKLLSNGEVLIGYQLAKSLSLTRDDQLMLYFAPEQEVSRNSLYLEKNSLKISGIFRTGIEEFDTNLILCSLNTLHTLFPESGISSLSINYISSTNEQLLKKRLKKRFNLPVYSWKERYPALVAALKLETYASVLILILMVLVASMTILSLLFMQITQKRKDIAILQTLGASTASIRLIFIIIGLTLCVGAALTGLLCALCIGFLLKHYLKIELPDAYFVSYLPIHLDPIIFLTVFFIVCLLGFFAILYATRTIKTLNIAQILRFES